MKRSKDHRGEVVSPCAKNSKPQAMTRSFPDDVQKGELVQKVYYHHRMMRPIQENNHEFSLKDEV